MTTATNASTFHNTNNEAPKGACGHYYDGYGWVALWDGGMLPSPYSAVPGRFPTAELANRAVRDAQARHYGTE